MKSENPLLKEKEITRDYYLKRMLIWQQISGFVPSLLLLLISFILTMFIGGFLGWKKNDDKYIGAIAFLLVMTIGLTFIISVYYSRKYWKVYKECQELANPTFNSEQQHVIN